MGRDGVVLPRLYPWKSWLSGLTPNSAILGLITANVAIFVLWRTADEKFMINNFTISLDNIKNGRLHTLITHAFSHRDAWHIISNTIGLYFFGMNIAKFIGPKFLLKLYLVGALGGSAFYLAHQDYKAQISKKVLMEEGQSYWQIFKQSLDEDKRVMTSESTNAFSPTPITFSATPIPTQPVLSQAQEGQQNPLQQGGGEAQQGIPASQTEGGRVINPSKELVLRGRVEKSFMGASGALIGILMADYYLFGEAYAHFPPTFKAVPLALGIFAIEKWMLSVMKGDTDGESVALHLAGAAVVALVSVVVRKGRINQIS